VSRAIRIIGVFICFLIALLSDAHADEQLHKEVSWQTRLELSYAQTSGNTDTQTFAGALEMHRPGPINRFFVNSSILRAESDGEETANKFSADGRWERIFTERFFGLLTTGFSRDTFSGYDYRVFGGPGIGYDLIKRERHKLQGLLSFLYYHDEFSVSGKDSEGYLTVKVTAKYEWQIRDNLKLKETFDYFVSLKETERSFVDSITSVEVKINKALSIGVSYTVNYQNKPPSSDLENTDTTLLTKLIVDL
jgi:putative salt-induced outer membrane protein